MSISKTIKNISGILIIFTIFFASFLFKANTTHAAGKYIYWTQDVANGSTRLQVGNWLGYSKLEDCETERVKDQNKFYNISLSCYKLGETPAPGKIALPSSSATITKTPEALETKTEYKLLAPLPDGNGKDGKLTTFESKWSPGNPCALGKYLNIIIRLFIGFCAVLAMLMIIMGGFKYMTSVSSSEKGSGKDDITQAIFGLIIALGAYLLLYTINPNLLNFCSVGKTTAPATTQPANP